MENLPLHPAIVHVPMGLAALAPILAIGLALAVWRGWLPRRAWAVLVGVQALLLASGIVAMRTGEGEEERVEDRVRKALIEEHEEAAERFVWASGVTLAIGVVGLAAGGTVGSGALAATALATVVTAGLGYSVGHAGGTIVYGPEGLAPATTAAGGTPAAPGAQHDDDD